VEWFYQSHYLGLWEPPQENFEIGVLKSAFQCILSNHGFVPLLKKSNFTKKKEEIFAVIYSRKSSMCEPSTGLHVVVFKELIKLRVHSLEIKELILIIFLKENNLRPLFVPSLFSFQFIPGTEQRLLGFSLHFQRKN